MREIQTSKVRLIKGDNTLSKEVSLNSNNLTGATEWTGTELDFEDIMSNTLNMYRVLTGLLVITPVNVIVGMDIMIRMTGGTLDLSNSLFDGAKGTYDPANENKIIFSGETNSLGEIKVGISITQI